MIKTVYYVVLENKIKICTLNDPVTLKITSDVFFSADYFTHMCILMLKYI